MSKIVWLYRHKCVQLELTRPWTESLALRPYVVTCKIKHLQNIRKKCFSVLFYM